jgi:hypothetical protein
MAMSVGSASITITLSGTTLMGAYGGTGLAAFYAAARGARMVTSLNANLVAALAQAVTSGAPTAAITSAALTQAQGAAANLVNQCNDDATLVTYITTNGVAHVTANAYGSGIPASTVNTPLN